MRQSALTRHGKEQRLIVRDLGIMPHIQDVIVHIMKAL